MRNPAIPLASVLVLFGSAQALAQDQRRVPQPVSPLVKTTPPAAPIVRYFQTVDLIVDLWSDAVVKETRQGTRVTSAVFDVCYAAAPHSPRRDRFVVTLSPQGNKLVGSGQTQESKQPVQIEVTRRANDDGISLEGTVTLGTTTMEIVSSDNVEQTEAIEAGPDEGTVVPRPDSFADVSPNALALRVSRDDLAGVIRSLKAEKVKIVLDSLAADCAALRTGLQTVRVDVDPEQAPALLARLRGLSGVKGAGWTGGDHSFLNAVRLAGPQWRSGGKADTEKLTAAVGAALAKTTAATLQSAERDPTTGEITFKLRRPNNLVPGLDLSEVISITALAGPEGPDSTDALVLWVAVNAIEIVDEGPEPRLSLAQSRRPDADQAGGTLDLAVLLTDIARELNGQRWSAEDSVWR